MIKKILLLLLLILNSSCSPKDNYPDQSTFGWDIQVLDVLVGSKLSKDRTIEMYDGTSIIDAQTKVAENGMIFYVVNLSINKSDKSNEIWKWRNLALVIGDNEFYRIDDNFLPLLEYSRLPGTDINFGSNSGWIVFKTPIIKQETINLVYFDEFGRNAIPLGGFINE